MRPRFNWHSGPDPEHWAPSRGERKGDLSKWRNSRTPALFPYTCPATARTVDRTRSIGRDGEHGRRRPLSRPGTSSGTISRVTSWSANLSSRRRPLSHDAAEADVRHAGVDHLRLARGGTVAEAVVRGAEVRAALDHLARDAELRLVRVVALGLRDDARVDGRAAAGLDDLVGAGGDVPVARPLPDVARHVVEPVAVRRE